MTVARAYSDWSLYLVNDGFSSSKASIVAVSTVSQTSTANALTVDIAWTGGATLRYVLEGTFTYGANRVDLNSIAGSVTKTSTYYSNTLLQQETYTIAQELFSALSSGASSLTGDDIFYGSTESSVADSVMGNTGHDKFYGYGSGSTVDQFWGEAGIDTAVYRGKKSEYALATSTSLSDITGASNLKTTGFLVTDKTANRDGVDELKGVERLEFSDTLTAIDLDGHAGVVAKIIGAVFGKSSVANKEYVGIGLDLMDAGMSYANLMTLALDAAGVVSNDAVVSLLWRHVVGTEATAADKAPFLQMLNTGTSAAELGILAADHGLNVANINLVGLAQTGLDYI